MLSSDDIQKRLCDSWNKGNISLYQIEHEMSYAAYLVYSQTLKEEDVNILEGHIVAWRRIKRAQDNNCSKV